MKIKIRICSLLVLLSTGVFGQTEGVYDPYLVNPSLGGYNSFVKLGSIYQTEMSAYDYSPKSFLIWGTSPFNNQRVAGGFKIASQEGGVLNNISAEATFIYHVPVGSSKLSFGLSGSFNQLKLMKDRVEAFDINDPILQGAESGNWFNSNFGISFSQVGKYYIGLAAYNLLPSQTDWMVSSFENKADIMYVANGMYRFTLMENVLFLESSAFVNTYDFKKINYGAFTKFIINKNLEFGFGYKESSIIKSGFGINIQNLSFGYYGSYSFGTAGQYNYPFTKHSIVLMVKLPYSKSSKENDL
jgi:type IX secretion system PorP/SprF family membrane protein